MAYKKNIQVSTKPIKYNVSKLRDDLLRRVEQDYEEFKKTQTFKFPTWLYGSQKGKLFKVKVEDCPQFGDSAYLEFDSARTAFISVDMQIDFCGKKGYVDVMGYDLELTSAPIKPIKNVLDTYEVEQTSKSYIQGKDICLIYLTCRIIKSFVVKL